MQNSDIDLLSKLDGRRCRSCGERFAPIYGRIKRESAHAYSPRSIRIAAESMVDDEAGTYFECYECEARIRRRRLWLWSGLASLVLLALLARWLITGELS